MSLCVFLFSSALDVLKPDGALCALNVYTSKNPSVPRSDMYLEVVKLRDAYLKFRLVLRCILDQGLDWSVLVNNKLKIRINRDHTQNISL